MSPSYASAGKAEIGTEYLLDLAVLTEVRR